jgi:heme-degrading monooxygenase HmoA
MHIESKPSNHIYRVDKFIVPDSAREEFLARANAIREVLRKQEGFVRDAYLEQISGPGEFNIVTIAEWESQEHVEAAKSAVAALLKQSNFNPHEMYQRLGIKADIAFYKEAQL